MENGRARGDIERTTSGAKLPNEVISRLDNGLRLANILRPLFLWMELLPPVDLSVQKRNLFKSFNFYLRVFFCVTSDARSCECDDFLS